MKQRHVPLILLAAALPLGSCGSHRRHDDPDLNSQKARDEAAYLSNTVPPPDVLETASNEADARNGTVVEVYPPGDAETAPDK